MQDNSTENYNQLRKLIQADGNKELECRAFLHHVKTALIPETVLEFVYIDKERRGNSGDSDYVLSVKVQDETGLQAVKAFIWELKAPQCYIFEKETENRLRPSKELIKAENQLFHYFHENKGDENFKRDFQIVHSDNIYFGGIIIGRHDRWVDGDFINVDKRNKLYEKALTIRKQYIYDRWNIRILTWDYILDLLKTNQVLLQQTIDDTKMPEVLVDSSDTSNINFCDT